MKENSLVKSLLWVKKQLQMYLDIKPDAYAFKNIEKMKKEEPNLKMKLGWMEEYSQLQQEEDIYKMVRRAYKSNTIRKGEGKKVHKGFVKRNSMNPDLIKMKTQIIRIFCEFVNLSVRSIHHQMNIQWQICVCLN